MTRSPAPIAHVEKPYYYTVPHLVVKRAVEVLGEDKAVRWFKSPVRALDNQTPASLLGTEEGMKRIQDVLGMIEHGVW